MRDTKGLDEQMRAHLLVSAGIQCGDAVEHTACSNSCATVLEGWQGPKHSLPFFSTSKLDSEEYCGGGAIISPGQSSASWHPRRGDEEREGRATKTAGRHA